MMKTWGRDHKTVWREMKVRNDEWDNQVMSQGVILSDAKLILGD